MVPISVEPVPKNELRSHLVWFGLGDSNQSRPVEDAECDGDYRETDTVALRAIYQPDLDDSITRGAERQVDRSPIASLHLRKEAGRLASLVFRQSSGHSFATLRTASELLGVSLREKLKQLLAPKGAWSEIELVQAIQTNDCPESFRWFLDSAGLQRFATMHQMTYDLPTQSTLSFNGTKGMELKPVELNRRFEIVFADEEHMGDIAALIAHSFSHTLDCPELNDLRSLDACMEGYLATRNRGVNVYSNRDANEDTASAEATPWLLVYDRSSGKLAATAMLAETQTGLYELTYLAVHCDYRRRGLARQLLQCSFQAIANLSGGYPVRVWLGVDVRNVPAVDLYRQAGFVEFGQVDAWFWWPGRRQQSGLVVPSTETTHG